MIETNSRYAGPVEPAADELKPGSTAKPTKPVDDAPQAFQPPVSWPSWRLRAHSEIVVKLHELRGQLEAVDQRMRVFRIEHMAMVGTSLVIMAAKVTDRPSLDGEWNGLVSRRDVLLRQWQTALHEHADLKTQEEPKNASATLSGR